MTKDLELLVSGLRTAAHAANRYIANNINRHNFYEEKPLKRTTDTSNPVTEIDKGAEQVAVAALRAALPFPERLRIHGEEHSYEKTGDIRVDIDPIDGTKSWVRGEFLSSFSIGAHLGEHHVGVVYDFMRGIEYHTRLNNGRLEAVATFHNHGGLERALPVHTGKILNQYKIPSDDAHAHTQLFGAPPKYDIIGSIALNMAHVAYGALDGLVLTSQKTSYYDVSGGLALLKAAGASVCDYNGRAVTPASFNEGIIALQPHVHSPGLAEFTGKVKTADWMESL